MSAYRQTLANSFLSFLLNKKDSQTDERQTNKQIKLDYTIYWDDCKNILMLLNYSKIINLDITVYINNKNCINY